MNRSLKTCHSSDPFGYTWLAKEAGLFNTGCDCDFYVHTRLQFWS